VSGEGYWARYESLVDRQIREAEERGDFADLPGRGKPLAGIDVPYDENWWVRRWVEREGVPADALLPTPLQLRREVEQLPESVRDLRDETAVRAAASELNRRIAQWLRAPTGPAVPVRPVDVEAVVVQWRQHARARTPNPPRQDGGLAGGGGRVPRPDTASGAFVRWWRRLNRR
jgi:hypothetical protein